MSVDSSLTDEMRSRLWRVPEGIYLDTAAEGLFLSSHDEAWRKFSEAKSMGFRGRDDLIRIEMEARESVARLIGTDAGNVAFVASSSRALDIAIKSVVWQPGDVMVTTETEFPSTLFASEILRNNAVEVRTVPYRDGAVHTDDLVAAIDSCTKLVVVSSVSYRTGQYLDAKPITEAAHSNGALAFVDASQTIGALNFQVGDEDFVCSPSFKWLMGAHGVATLYASDRAVGLAEPAYAGYRGVTEIFPQPGEKFRLHDDARRFEEGMPNFLALAILKNSLDLIDEVGIATIDAHNRELVARLRKGLENIGVPVLSPGDQPRHGSIVAFETPKFQEIFAALAAQGTAIWARTGRVRISPHIHNNASEIDAFLEQLSSLPIDWATANV